MPATGMCDTQGVLTAGGTFLGEQAGVASGAPRARMTIGDITYTPGSPATVSAAIDAPAWLHQRRPFSCRFC